MTIKKPRQNAQFAARVRAIGERLALSDTQTAEYLGVPMPTIRKWLAGERAPSSATIRLLDVLDLISTLAPAIHAHLIPEAKTKTKRVKAIDQVSKEVRE